MSEVQYELKSPFSYAYKSDQVEASFITMTAPNFSHVDKATPLKQAFAAALKEKFAKVDADELKEAQEIVAAAAEDKTNDDGVKDDDDGIDSQFVLSVLFQWSGDLTKVFRTAQSLFIAGAAKVEGETPVTKAILEKMTLADFEGMVGTYLSNFIVPSLMDGQ